MENPKNVQIPYEALLAVYFVLSAITKDSLPESVKAYYETAYREIYNKTCRVRNRSAYGDIIAAQNDEEREAAKENYIATKGLSKYGI